MNAKERLDAWLGRRPTSVIERRVRRACYFALAALALICWSLVDPSPLPVIGAMTVGQVIGTFSLAWFLLAIVADLRRTYVRSRPDATPAPGASGDTARTRTTVADAGPDR
jgi:hypothetical protein